MSTIQQAPPPKRSPPQARPEGEPHFVLQDISWQFYEAFLTELGDRPSLRVTYDRGSMELMTISNLHEWYKRVFDRMILFLALELRVPIRAGGSATFKRADILRGLEPDECYWFRTAHLLRGRREIDLTRDPIFELALEIELSRSDVDRMSIYAALGVAEVWQFDGEALRVSLLQTDGTYLQAAESRFFPAVPLAELVQFVNPALDAEDDNSFLEIFRNWIRDRILPRWQASNPPA
jgi:hypothetical protein